MLQIFIYFYMIKAFAIRDILKWEDIIHFVVKVLFNDYSCEHTKILCCHHWDINTTINHRGYWVSILVTSKLITKAESVIQDHDTAGPDTTRAERWSCVGLRTAAAASLYTVVVGLRLTPLLWSHLRQLLMFLLHLLEVMALVDCHC